MKASRLAAVLASCFLSVMGLKAQGLDSLTRQTLSDKLDEYLVTIEGSGTDVQKEEADFLIESASDSLVRQFVAVKVYNHYFTSKVMGAEAVAIHIWIYRSLSKISMLSFISTTLTGVNMSLNLRAPLSITITPALTTI